MSGFLLLNFGNTIYKKTAKKVSGKYVVKMEFGDSKTLHLYNTTMPEHNYLTCTQKLHED